MGYKFKNTFDYTLPLIKFLAMPLPKMLDHWKKDLLDNIQGHGFMNFAIIFFK